VVVALALGCVGGAGEEGSGLGAFVPAAPDGKADKPTGEAQKGILSSREYKVLLDPELFDNDPAEFAQYYAEELIAAIAPTSIAAVGDLALAEERIVQFYDSASCDLRAASFVLRDRSDVDPDGKRKLTLKFRSTSRNLAAEQDLSSSVDGAKQKFEEDIVPPSVSKFSSSASPKVSTKLDVEEIKDAVAIFPGLASLDLDDELDLEVVGGIVAREAVYEGVELDLGEGIRAELSVTLWYLDDATPVVAEASFSYGDEEEHYPSAAVANGKALFDAMQALVEWRAVDSMTKTALVYSRSDCL